jgi:hypothetical protein
MKLTPQKRDLLVPIVVKATKTFPNSHAIRRFIVVFVIARRSIS